VGLGLSKLLRHGSGVHVYVIIFRYHSEHDEFHPGNRVLGLEM
jgi:hypothetical protein